MADKSVPQRRSRKPKLISSTEAGNIIRLPDGRFRIDCVDSNGKRHRPVFASMEEAEHTLNQIAAKKSKGEFLAVAANTTFDKALDLLIERNKREGLSKGTKDRVESVIRFHLRPVFGSRKLSEFPAQRMRFVQEWFDDRAQHHNAAAQTLAHVRSAIKLAFDEAIKAGLMGAPNPATEFNLRVPQIVERKDRAVLTLEEVSTLVRTSLRRADREHELVYRTRFMLLLIGLLTALRPGECCGLWWDCVDFESRKIWVRRTVRKGGASWETASSTKTGKSGFRSVPMSPILYAALRAHGDRLQALGRKLEGPILVTDQAKIITPEAVSGDHWPAISAKAGFIDQDGGLDHTFYALRHTVANLWRTIGIPLDRLQTLMGHSTINTTTKHYLHETPHYDVIRREVKALGSEDTPEGFIDALGFVLFRRWREEGIEIECAPPRSATPKIGGPAALLALPGNIIDLEPNAVSNEMPSGPVIRTARELQRWQRARAKELYLANRTKPDIMAELGISLVTLDRHLRMADVPHVQIGRLPAVARQDLMRRIGRSIVERPKASSTEIAREHNVEPRRVTMYARRLGHSMPHRPGAHKIGKYHEELLAMRDAGKTCREMEAELKRRHPGKKTPSHSGVAYYFAKLGIKTKLRGGGLRVENYDAQIRELHAAGKSAEEIARELDGPSNVGIRRYLKRLGLRPVPGNR